jgi:sulfhydrogenase subunit alpha
MHTFDLNLADISKMEGKGSLDVKVRDGKIVDFKFGITEFKRFYTQAIRGKDIVALPQLSARICGTCSNAHLICAIKAVEDAIGLDPSEQTKIFRELLNYGLNIRDHALHLYVFVLPDILGIDNILELDEKDPVQHQLLDDTFQVKKVGNMLAKVIGGRSVHAPFVTVGGFTKLPDAKEFPEVLKELEIARVAILRLIDVFKNCDFLLNRDIDFVALMDKKYSFLGGNVMTSKGDRFEEKDFGNYLERTVIPYSHASGYKFKGQIHMIGAIARMNLGKEFLHENTKKDAADALKLFPTINIYHNNLAQAIEILHCIDVSLDILKNLEIKDEKPVPVVRKAGVGIGVIEAPRGTLYYKLEIDEKGKVIKGDIVVPTGQNQIGIEKSLYQFFSENIDKEKDFLISEAEKIIRSYDPCMSCASHFLKVKWS